MSSTAALSPSSALALAVDLGGTKVEAALVTDQAKLIRLSVGDTRVTGRNTQGVTLFSVAKGEHVVSAAKIDEEEHEAGVRSRGLPDRRRE